MHDRCPKFFQQRGPVLVGHRGDDCRVGLQGLQQIALIPAFNDREGIQVHGPPRKLLEEHLRCRAGFDQVLAGMDATGLPGQASVQAEPEILIDNPGVDEFPGDGSERTAR